MGLKERLVELLKTVPTRKGGYCDLEGIADHLIANGVEIPVRCKDCTHREECNLMVDNDYCSDGEH